jgi:nicotinamide-nucleotide amidase
MEGGGLATPELAAAGTRVGALLRARNEDVAAAEGAGGGLASAALLAVPGASAYYRGGAVIYTLAASRAFMAGAIEPPPGMRGATEGFALWLARSVRARLGTTWALGEGGAAGPSGNPYGDPPGHAWVAVSGPVERTLRISTGSDDRAANMVAFARAGLDLLEDCIRAGGS